MSTSLSAKYSLVLVAALLLLIACLYLVFFSAGDENNTTQVHSVNSQRTKLSVLAINKNEKTIATAWQWEGIVEPSEEKSTAVFSAEAVYEALHRVRLDEQGNVILDHETLIALNETLDDSRLQLNEVALSELQIIIRQGLPGDVGEDVAKIVGDYYHLLGASKEFNAIYEHDSATDQESESTIEQHQESYRELMALRELYLGTDVADKLFSTSDANARYMFDMAKLEQNTELTEQEKQQTRAEITDRHTAQTIKISNWNERHNVFLAAKKNIQMVSMDEEEKQAQLTELMHQHFNPEELTHVGHLQLDNP